eukprot:scaffold160125_cov31-Tisochrysis_lutea.AAC.2
MIGHCECRIEGVRNIDCMDPFATRSMVGDAGRGFPAMRRWRRPRKQGIPKGVGLSPRARPTDKIKRKRRWIAYDGACAADG